MLDGFDKTWKGQDKENALNDLTEIIIIVVHLKIYV